MNSNQVAIGVWPHAATSQALLDAMDGIAYLVDAEGRIAAYGRPRWDDFAGHNDGPSLCDARSLLGRPLFDFVAGEDVRAAYRRWMDDLAAGKRDRVTFAFRCDSPDQRRELRLTIHPVRLSVGSVGYLFQSQPISETVRPPMALFDSAGRRADQSLPVVKICSFCADVWQTGSQDAGDWVSAEDYYRQGGTSKVRVSHGICPDCHVRRLVAV